MTTSIAYKEKNQAAASSVLAAIGLTSLKVVVGVLTGSLAFWPRRRTRHWIWSPR